jgi:hypothetical protein
MHGELTRALGHIESKLDDALKILAGNGKPGLRETQAELARLKDEFEKQCSEMAETMARETERRDSRWMFFVRPLLPIIYAAVFSGLYISFT